MKDLENMNSTELLYISKNTINVDVIDRGKKFLTLTKSMRYTYFVFIFMAILLSIICFVIHRYSLSIAEILGAIFLCLIYYYVINRNTKLLKEPFVKDNSKELIYDLKFTNQKIEMLIDHNVVQTYDYRVFKEIFQTEKEYILITEGKNFLAIQKKNIDHNDIGKFKDIIICMNLKKHNKIF